MSTADWPTPPAGDPWAPAEESIRVEFGMVHDCRLHGGQPQHGDDGTWMSLGEDPQGALDRFRKRADGHLVVRTHIISEWVGIDPDQMWFWTPENLASERQVDRHIAAGEVKVFDSHEDFLRSLQEGE